MSRLDDLEATFKSLAEQFLAKLEESGIKVSVTSGRRTIAQQNQLYAQGRTLKGDIVTNAKGGQSPHNFGMAIDVCPYDDNGRLWWNAPKSVWLQIGIVGKECGLIWGGDFKSITDFPHFEATNWREVQAAWKAGKIEVA